VDLERGGASVWTGPKGRQIWVKGYQVGNLENERWKRRDEVGRLVKSVGRFWRRKRRTEKGAAAQKKGAKVNKKEIG
jgi:hypothetical protein